MVVYGVAIAARSDVRAKVNRSEMRLAQSRLEAAGVDQPLRPGTLEGEVQRSSLAAARIEDEARSLLDSRTRAKRNSASCRIYWVEVAVTGSNGTEVRLATAKIVMASAMIGERMARLKTSYAAGDSGPNRADDH